MNNDTEKTDETVDEKSNPEFQREESKPVATDEEPATDMDALTEEEMSEQQ